MALKDSPKKVGKKKITTKKTTKIRTKVKAKIKTQVKNQITQPKVKRLSSTEYKITFPNNQVLYLLGTVHISPESVKLVESTIKKQKPQAVFIELDEERKKNLIQKIQDLDIIKIIRSKKTAYFLSYIFLSIIQKKFAEKTGSPPGEEFKKAILLAKEIKAEEFLIDRNAKITINRIYRKLTWREKIRLLFSLFSFEDLPSSKQAINKDNGEKGGLEFNYDDITKQDVVSEMINEMGQKFANIKKVLIDERDVYMAKKILLSLEAKKKSRSQVKSVAVVGAGHLPGMLNFFKKPDSVKGHSLTELEVIPPKPLVDKLLPFALVAFILLVLGLGFIYSDNQNILAESLGIWVLVNGTLCALGSLIALANPLTIVAAFLIAPFTSLNPTIGAGMLTSLVQAVLSPPRVQDFQDFSLKMANIRSWWKNRLGKVLLVFIFSSLGSAIGTLVAFPFIISLF